MTRNVVSVKSDSTILEAGNLMLQSRVSGLPVVNSAGRLVGIITERDFLRPTRNGAKSARPRWLELITNHKRREGLGRLVDEQVESVMTPNPISVSEDAPLEDVLRQMEKHDIKRLPVTKGDQLVGIVSRSDLLRALMQSLRKVSESSSEDAMTRERMAALERDYWLRHAR